MCFLWMKRLIFRCNSVSRDLTKKHAIPAYGNCPVSNHRKYEKRSLLGQAEDRK